MKNPDRYQTRRFGQGGTEVARECVAGYCDVLVWPTENDRNLCARHAQMLEGYRRALEINDQLLARYCSITGLTFSTIEQRASWRDKIFIPRLIANRPSAARLKVCEG